MTVQASPTHQSAEIADPEVEDPTEDQPELGAGLLTDYVNMWVFAHARRWFGSATFTCKSYRMMMVGHNDALANQLCDGKISHRSGVLLDPDRISKAAFLAEVKSVKQRNSNVHISTVHKVPGRIEFTLTVFGSSPDPRR